MGPCAGLLMADLGASVIKVEPAPNGDRTRDLTGFAGGFFATFNRNKRSLAIDLKNSDGQAILHRLVETTDIVIENYGPGTMEKLGCGWDSLSTLNTRLVYLALKGYLGGPYQDRPALDEVVQFQSGLAYMTGPAGRPLRAGASIVDILGAVFGITGVLAALRERDSTGLGQRVGSSLFETAAFLMAPHMVGGMTTGETVPPMTERKGAWGVYDVFRCSDEQSIFIGVTSDAQWSRFCASFEFKDLGSDTALITNEQRNLARATLIPDLNQRIIKNTYAEVVARCTEADVSWSPIAQPEDLFSNEQLLAQDGLLEIALETARQSANASCLVPNLPLEFGTTKQRAPLRSQPPGTGQHTREILLEIGLNERDITQLSNQGVVQAP